MGMGSQPRIPRGAGRCGIRRAARAAVALDSVGPPIESIVDDIVGRRQLAFLHPAIHRARADAFLLGEISFRQPLTRATEHRGLERIQPREDGVEDELAYGRCPAEFWTTTWVSKIVTVSSERGEDSARNPPDHRLRRRRARFLVASRPSCSSFSRYRT